MKINDIVLPFGTQHRHHSQPPRERCVRSEWSAFVSLLFDLNSFAWTIPIEMNVVPNTHTLTHRHARIKFRCVFSVVGVGQIAKHAIVVVTFLLFLVLVIDVSGAQWRQTFGNAEIGNWHMKALRPKFSCNKLAKYKISTSSIEQSPSTHYTQMVPHTIWGTIRMMSVSTLRQLFA